MKLCVDCKHFVPIMRWEMADGDQISKDIIDGECHKWPEQIDVDLVLGTKFQRGFPRCRNQRQLDTPSAINSGFCGKSGRYFQPKDITNG